MCFKITFVNIFFLFGSKGVRKYWNKVVSSRYPTFHGARMYSDAARLKVYEKSGTFPKVTKSAGLASLKTVLEEDAK